VQARLGHADLKPTFIYLHISERDLRAAGTPLRQSRVIEPGPGETVPEAVQEMTPPPFEVSHIIHTHRKSFIANARGVIEDVRLGPLGTNDVLTALLAPLTKSNISANQKFGLAA
jgi:hypothetical protein